MLKKIVVTILIVIFPVFAEAQLKVGMMNPDRVMDALPETAQVQQELQQYFQQRQEEFSREYSVFIEMMAQFEDQLEAGALTDAERQAEEERLMEKEEELNNLEQRLRQQIQMRQEELLGPIMQRVENVMVQIAMELDLDVVLNQQTSQGDLIVYYASERGVDITDRVIEELTTN